VQKLDATGTLNGSALNTPLDAQTSGTVTWLPPSGTTITSGQQLFRIDNVPTVLLYGATPAWRAFSPGMADGPDLAELETNLLALGFGQPYGLVADGHYGTADEEAIGAFAASEQLPMSGNSLALGSVIFTPGPVLVVADASSLGTLVSPGTAVIDGEGTTPQVVMQVEPAAGPTVEVGDPASITTDQGQPALEGTVLGVSSVPPAGTGGSTSNNSAGSGQVLYLTLSLTDPPPGLELDGTVVNVQLQLAVARAVLIVPVAALVALVEGGYALQVDDGHGHTHLIPVTVGAIDNVDDLAQVSGAQLRAGLLVEVPAA
jgi:peptidoglycan hydrolase-like protein with peptidoglycan-binding domain